MTFEEKILESESIYEGRLIQVHKDVVTTINGTSTREIVEHCSGAAMVALKPNGNILLVNQYRLPAKSNVWEIPAGKLDPNEDPEHAARRELREETGYTAGKVEFLTTAYPSVGYATEKIYFYLMTELTEGETDFDDNEAIDMVEVPIEQVAQDILAGRYQDVKLIAGVMMVMEKIRRGDLEAYLK